MGRKQQATADLSEEAAGDRKRKRGAEPKGDAQIDWILPLAWDRNVIPIGPLLDFVSSCLSTAHLSKYLLLD
jgi:hypothetical protein